VGEKEVIRYGDALIDLNKELLSTRYPYDDTQFAKLCLHIVVGQLPNVLKLKYNIGASLLDLRIHGTVLSPSGTNKGSVVSYMESLCKGLHDRGTHMQFKTMGKFTDSALVGMPAQKTEKGDKIDPETGEVMRDEDGKAIKESKTVESHYYGALHPSRKNSILAWSEGTQVLDVNTVNLNQSTMNILQQCMNPIDTPDNKVSKLTGLGEIEYNTTCSVFLVTYKPFTITQKITSTGFLQRQIVIIREPTAEDAMLVSKNACRDLTRTPKFKVPLDELIDRLAEINEFAGTIEEAGGLYVPDSVKELLEYKQLEFHMLIKHTNILVRQKLGEFVRRWSVNILYNLMFQHAIISLRREVNKADVDYAARFLLPVWSEFSAFLENALLMDKRETENISKQYSSIIITYHRLAKEAQMRREEMLPEELDATSHIDGFIWRETLVVKLASDWARSTTAVNELLRQIETDLFISKQVSSTPDEYMPEGGDEDFPTNTWIKLRPGALRTISVN
jgi:hypothetical protein